VALHPNETVVVEVVGILEVGQGCGVGLVAMSGDARDQS